MDEFMLCILSHGWYRIPWMKITMLMESTCMDDEGYHTWMRLHKHAWKWISSIGGFVIMQPSQATHISYQNRLTCITLISLPLVHKIHGGFWKYLNFEC
jgi:hypothetical protein